MRPVDFEVEKTNVRLGANEFFVILSFEVNMRPLCFQTKMSVVVQIRESVVLFVMN